MTQCKAPVESDLCGCHCPYGAGSPWIISDAKDRLLGKAKGRLRNPSCGSPRRREPISTNHQTTWPGASFSPPTHSCTHCDLICRARCAMHHLLHLFSNRSALFKLTWLLLWIISNPTINKWVSANELSNFKVAHDNFYWLETALSNFSCLFHWRIWQWPWTLYWHLLYLKVLVTIALDYYVTYDLFILQPKLRIIMWSQHSLKHRWHTIMASLMKRSNVISF